MKKDLYKLYQQARAAASEADCWKQKAADAKAELLQAMQEQGINKLVYEKAGSATIVQATSTLVIDGDAVKAAFPDWKWRFAKAKHTSAYLRFKN